MTEIDTMTDDDLRAAIAEALGADMEFNPDWPNDVAAALALMTRDALLGQCDTTIWPGEWHCISADEKYTYVGYADTPARAVCRWWLKWKAAQL